MTFRRTGVDLAATASPLAVANSDVIGACPPRGLTRQLRVVP